MKLKIYTTIVTLFCVAVLGTQAFAQSRTTEMRDAEERVEKASKVMRDIMKIPANSIPEDLLAKAHAVIVFPGALKLGFIVGGQGGKGVVVRRLSNGWSAPAFLNMAGGSIGPQIGGQRTDYVLLVMNEDGLRGLLEDKFEIGGEGSVSAGPVGRTAAASTNVTLNAGILTYSRSRGLFAGASLKGVVISHDNDVNRAIYQKSANELMLVSPVVWTAAPKKLQRFPQTVANFAG